MFLLAVFGPPTVTLMYIFHLRTELIIFQLDVDSASGILFSTQGVPFNDDIVYE